MNNRVSELAKQAELLKRQAEHAIVSSMLEATCKASEPVDLFSTWLLVGTAAVASFLLANPENVLPLLGAKGFASCGLILCLSSIFGLLSKVYALRFRVGQDASLAVHETASPFLAKHQAEAKALQAEGARLGAHVNTDIDMSEVVSTFSAVLPRWHSWLTRRKLKRYGDDPHFQHLVLLHFVRRQASFAFLQVATFLVFLLTGFLLAAKASVIPTAP